MIRKLGFMDGDREPNVHEHFIKNQYFFYNC